MQERLVQEIPLKWWHPSIFPSFTVEQQVSSKSCASNDGSAIDKSLCQVARWLLDLVPLLHVGSTEDILEDRLRLRE